MGEGRRQQVRGVARVAAPQGDPREGRHRVLPARHAEEGTAAHAAVDAHRAREAQTKRQDLAGRHGHYARTPHLCCEVAALGNVHAPGRLRGIMK